MEKGWRHGQSAMGSVRSVMSRLAGAAPVAAGIEEGAEEFDEDGVELRLEAGEALLDLDGESGGDIHAVGVERAEKPHPSLEQIAMFDDEAGVVVGPGSRRGDQGKALQSALKNRGDAGQDQRETGLEAAQAAGAEERAR